MENLKMKSIKSKIQKESILKSLFCGLLIGFSVLLITSLIFWIVGLKLIVVAVVAFAVVSAGSTVAFYFLKFKPTTKQLAVRVDELGLEERLITMTELEGNDSVMAKLQREDTKKALGTFNDSLLKICISVPLIVSLAVVSVFGITSATVSTLYSLGKIESGSDYLIPEKEPNIYELVYEAQGDGVIEGEILQLVEEGMSATAVKAEAFENCVFTGWSDGYTSPYRLDSDVKESKTVYAIFQEIEEGADELEDPDGSEQDQDNNSPSDNSEQENNNDQNQPPDQDPGAGQGGVYEEYNQVIDGETYYGDKVFEAAYKDAMEEISDDEDLSDDDKDIISDYLDTIQK